MTGQSGITHSRGKRSDDYRQERRPNRSDDAKSPLYIQWYVRKKSRKRGRKNGWNATQQRFRTDDTPSKDGGNDAAAAEAAA